MKARPGTVKPANVDPRHTRGWTFTVFIHGVEWEPVGLNLTKATVAKEIMRRTVAELNNEGD